MTPHLAESRIGEPSVGEVVAFDEARGIGSVLGDDGATWMFHCTQIAGGTRSVRVGVRVRFALAPGALGEWEATAVEELTASPGRFQI